MERPINEGYVRKGGLYNSYNSVKPNITPGAQILKKENKIEKIVRESFEKSFDCQQYSIIFCKIF